MGPKFLLAVNGLFALVLFVESDTSVRDNAHSYLLSQIDPETKTFPEGERAAGVLGLIAMSPKKKLITEDEKLQRQVEIQSVGTDFLKMITFILRKYPKDPPLKHVDDSTLLKYLAVLRGRCLNAKDYYGYDLIAEVLRRVDGETNIYGGMILALCNNGERYTKDQILRLAKTKNCNTCEFHAEEVAMNLMAATCVVTRKNAYDSSPDDTDRYVIPQLINDLTLAQRPDGSFGSSFTGTALALQVLNRVPSELPSSLNLDATVALLTKMQKSDGSFGSSVELTSLAIPAFTGQTAADLHAIECPSFMSNTAKVSYIVEDTVVSGQATRDHFKAPINSAFVRGLALKGSQNKETFALHFETSSLGSNLVAVNNLRNSATASWKVYRIEKNGDETDITRSLNKEPVRGNSLYKLSYSVNTV